MSPDLSFVVHGESPDSYYYVCNLHYTRTIFVSWCVTTPSVVSLYVYIDCCSAFVDVVGARAGFVSGKQPEVVSKHGKQPEVVSTNDFRFCHAGFVQRKATSVVSTETSFVPTSTHIERQQGQGVEHPGSTLVSLFSPRDLLISTVF